MVALSTGNVVVTSPFDNAGGTGAGAVYLFKGTTGALISTLIGSHAGDHIGSGVTALNNGNFVVTSPNWNSNEGAVTWGSGTTGVSGSVSATDSLVNTGDQSGTGFGVTALNDGNYVVSTSNWNNGEGAVTWGSGATGVSGAISAANSLVGSTANDGVGSGGVLALSDGNYVVSSPNWNNGAATGAGAVTWGSGTTGVSGPVSAANSLVGSTANDAVGNDSNPATAGWGFPNNGVTALSDGNYVVSSTNWTNGTAADAGAVTWGSGTAGVSGPVSAANSLVGSTANDSVGTSVTALSDGNYVVSSPQWTDGTAAGAGAATWGSGTAGVSGPVSATNSLVGSKAGDGVGSGVTALTNGNYVVSSPAWTNGAAAGAGAVTWGSGMAGVSGAVSAANSLVGSTATDGVGGGTPGVTALSDGNYVVSSPNWNNGAATGAGAVTWGSGTAGVSGPVSAANSLVGSKAGDGVGSSVAALTNGNYVVSSFYWDNGAAASAGAATWGSGTTGVSGPVSAANSLVGSKAGDGVGSSVAALTNGNYVVVSPGWNTGAGAVTWGSGTTGVSGPVSAANSLVGSTATDGVGDTGVAVLSDGNYVVSSPQWTNGTANGAGASTWGSGTSGVSGPVSAANSLVGSKAGDGVGSGVTALTNGNYVVSSSRWTNGTAAGAGAVTWGSGTTGVSGPVSAANSLVGTNDSVGSIVTALSDGNYVVSSTNWTNGAAAVTWGSGTAGVTGIISTMNSAIGSVANSGPGTVASSGPGTVALDNVNGTFFVPFVTDGGGQVLVGSQATGFPPAQTITFGPLPNRTYGDAPFTVSASASSNLPVSFSIVAGAAYASITGTTVAILGATPAGKVVTVEANQAGNGSYSAARSVDQSFTINQATPTPTPPQVLAIAGVSSRKGLTSFTVSYNEPLSSSSASSSGLYQVFAAVTKKVKKHKETLFTKALAIRSVTPNSTGSTVTIKLARPFKGQVQVMVGGNISAGNGASNSVRFTQDL